MAQKTSLDKAHEMLAANPALARPEQQLAMILDLQSIIATKPATAKPTAKPAKTAPGK